MNPKGKEYLGDAVYARQEGGMIVLTAENGVRATDIIYLEKFVLLALVGYAKRLGMLGEADLG